MRGELGQHGGKPELVRGERVPDGDKPGLERGERELEHDGRPERAHGDRGRREQERTERERPAGGSSAAGWHRTARVLRGVQPLPGNPPAWNRSPARPGQQR